MKILIVEDSRVLQNSLQIALRKAGYAVDVADEGETGLWMAESNSYDEIILDLMLPKINGLTILKRLREKGNETPVLILSALDAVDDRVKGLRCGADDYLTKPFALEELLARVETLLRRGRNNRNPVMTVGDLEIDTGAKTVKKDGRNISLRPREYSLLEYLASRTGAVVSRSEIEEHLYDEQTDLFSNTVDSAICNLRKAIASENQQTFIRTRKGMGYILETAV